MEVKCKYYIPCNLRNIDDTYICSSTFDCYKIFFKENKLKCKNGIVEMDWIQLLILKKHVEV